MRIQHNIMAMNSYRNYTNNASALSKNLEKLSSGYKINRAGDDAAGLAISEKMRAQIQGLNAAQKNVKDGISLVKTAEGAMQEIQDMLSRMKYLATQSANGTYDSDVDRAALQDEINSLRSEINRIADSANFNGIKLLNGEGSAEGKTSIDAEFQADVTMLHTVDDIDPDELKAAFGSQASLSIGGDDAGDIDTIEFKFEPGEIEGADGSTDGPSVTASFDENGKLTITIKQAGSSATETINAASIQAAINQAIADDTGLDVTITVGGTIDDSLFKSDTGDSGAIGQDLTITVSHEEDPTSAATFESQYGITTDGIDVSSLSYDEEGEYDVEINFDQNGDTLTVTIGDKTFTAAITDDAATLNAAGTITLVNEDDETETITLTLAENQTLIGTDGDGTSGTIGKLSAEENTSAGGSGFVSMQLQIGDSSDSWDKLTFYIGDMHVGAMGAFKKITDEADGIVGTFTINPDDIKLEYGEHKGEAATIENIDITSVEGSNEALEVIKNAINYVSSVRGQLGAVQNRLEHTQNNLSVMAENIQDAESTIRDTDVADEMMGYVKNNILIQSAQAMLAQANQVPQGVLQLLG